MFMIIKERGAVTALWIIDIVFTVAILFSGLLNWTLRSLAVTLSETEGRREKGL